MFTKDISSSNELLLMAILRFLQKENKEKNEVFMYFSLPKAWWEILSSTYSGEDPEVRHSITEESVLLLYTVADIMT